ncbi:MAG: DUF58 domain-containing protein [Bacteroidia bacterium]
MENKIDYQKVQHFSHLELIAKQVVEGFMTGLHKSPFHGFSVEFAEHRLYNKGESTKHIDWKLFGKTDKLFVKRYEEETNLRCQILIDNSTSMLYPLPEKGKKDFFNKLKFSVYCAAALTYLLRKQRDAVGLSVFSETMEQHTAAKSSPVHYKILFQELEKLIFEEAKIPQRKNTFAASAIHQIAESIHKRSLVIIFSDMMDSKDQNENVFQALQHLKHNKHEVVLFHVVDKSTEIDFEFENRPYSFIDVETGENIKVHPNKVKENYVKTLAAYKKELMLRCGQYHIDFVEADISKGFEQVLLPYLLKRTRMQ